jgi:N-acetylglutamate synthase-like GNAT family acetyltransferase
MFRGTEACGCVAIERASPKLAYLERLAIVPEERRRGLGETLVRHALHEARVSGASTVSVAIIATHLELNAWYQKLGFIEETTRLFSHLPFSVTFLSYRLT